MTQQATLLACPTCGQPLSFNALVCPNCHTLVHRARLEQLSQEAQQYEAFDPATAVRIWRQALELLPSDSQQYRLIYDRMRALAGGQVPPHVAPAPTPNEAAYPTAPRNDTLTVALLKTGISMAISIVLYAFVIGSFSFAVGFVLLILIHEMGHVFAMRHYGLRASPPIFIPFMGALINLRQRPPNAKVEAVVGIGGPVLGGVAALLVFASYFIFGHRFQLMELAFWGLFLNLFNLVPVPPLDGGRVTAAVNPRIWILGLAILVGWMIHEWIKRGSPSFIMLLILVMAWPRIMATLQSRGAGDPYYNIPKKDSTSIAVAYVVLAILLAIPFFIAKRITGIEVF